MAFDLATAKPAAAPATAPANSGGFDLGTARPSKVNEAAFSGPAAIPGATPEQLARARMGAPARQQEEDTLFGKIISPIDAGISVLGGLASSLVAVPGGFIKSAYDELSGGPIRTPEENAVRIRDRLTPKPTTASARRMLETMGEAAPVLEALPGMSHDLATLSRAAVPAVRAAGDMTAAGSSRLSQIARNTAGAVVPRIDPGTATLARTAQAKYNIPLRPDQLYENRITRMLGETSEKVPLAGSKADVRQEAFNRALIRTIGGDEDAVRLTPDVYDKALRKAGQKIGDIAAKSPLPLDTKLNNVLDSHVANAAQFETADVGRVVTGYINDLRSKATNGIIPGEAVRKINTAIGNKMRATSDGDLKYALGQLQDDLQDAVQTRLSGEDLAALRGARQQYAAAKTLEPLVAKSPMGDISPAGLMGRVTANNAGKSRMARGGGGDLGELARIGQRFLKEPASSGTAERGLAYGIAGGGVVAEPATAAGVYSLANIYNRVGPALSRRLSGVGNRMATGEVMPPPLDLMSRGGE